jgi:hypothetical protein
VILGDEFAEVQIAGDAILTRQDLRRVCDTHTNKAEIIAALQQ